MQNPRSRVCGNPRAGSLTIKPYCNTPDHFEQQGWQSQLERVERLHRRAIRALDPYNGRVDQDALDFIYAVFQSAYHLRDWLQNSGAALKADLDRLMASSHALQLCRDFCNGSKHFSLNATSKSDHIGLIQEYVPLSVGSTSEGGSKPRLFDFEGRDGNNEYTDISELMTECVQAWQEFCAILVTSTDSLPDGG